MWRPIINPYMPYEPQFTLRDPLTGNSLSYKHVNVSNMDIQLFFKEPHSGHVMCFQFRDPEHAKKILDLVKQRTSWTATYEDAILNNDELAMKYIIMIDKPSDYWDLEKLEPKFDFKCICGGELHIVRIIPFSVIRHGKKIDRTDVYALCTRCGKLYIFGLHCKYDKSLNVRNESFETEIRSIFNGEGRPKRCELCGNDRFEFVGYSPGYMTIRINHYVCTNCRLVHKFVEVVKHGSI